MNMWMQRKKAWLTSQGVVPALSVVLYILFFTMLLTNGNQVFPHINPRLAPLMFLTLFCFSALTCALMVFYKPYLLFVDKKGKEAIQLVVATTKWLGIFAVVIVSVVAMFSR